MPARAAGAGLALALVALLGTWPAAAALREVALTQGVVPRLPGAQAVRPDAGTPVNATDHVLVRSMYGTPFDDLPTGLSVNAEGDLLALVSTFYTNAAVVALLVLLVSGSLRTRFPEIFFKEDQALVVPDGQGWFDWVRCSWGVGLFSQDGVKGVDEACGLDQALLLHFTNLCMKVSAVVGLPTLLILGPLHWAFGGNAAGGDHLSYLSMGNVQLNSWLYWVHPLVVWGVTATVKHFVFRAQGEFMRMRAGWLEGLDPVRTHTVLVEGIPEGYQSDEELLAFFRRVFSEDAVRSAYVAKDTQDLPVLVRDLEDAQARLAGARLLAVDGRMPLAHLRRLGPLGLGPPVEAVPHYEEVVRGLRERIAARRAELRESFRHPGPEGGHCSRGFVAFTERKYAAFSLRLADQLSASEEEWDITCPPDPADVRWSDIVQDPRGEFARALVGYGLIASLYFLYLPIIVGISNIAQTIKLGALQPLWSGMAPTIGVTVMMSFTPTVLTIILRMFFTLNADAWVQHKLQIWYFWFQVVFVLMAAAVGQNATAFTRGVLASPFSLFTTLADTMPFATHFYMNFLLVQWMSHALNLTRYANILKYLMLRSALYSREDAMRFAEPEDQDYYGLGSRSARWTIHMLVGIIYGTLCPPIYLICFLNFLTCRVFYGYLIPFAEIRKPDLGGVFWVQMLRHLLIGCVIYSILMTGVLLHRAGGSGPAVLAAPSVAFAARAVYKFDVSFAWKNLPIDGIVGLKAGGRQLSISPYVQTELYEPEIPEDPALATNELHGLRSLTAPAQLGREQRAPP